MEMQEQTDSQVSTPTPPPNIKNNINITGVFVSLYYSNFYAFHIT